MKQRPSRRSFVLGTGATALALDKAVGPVAALADDCARTERRRFLGIDSSPAPGMDSSIGEVVETLTRTPFGGASTLEACIRC